MDRRPSIEDFAKIAAHGYRVEVWTERGWLLRDETGHSLMIGDHGCVAPTQWEAVAEGLKRIAADEPRKQDLTDQEFRALLNAYMVSDPYPWSESDDALITGLLHRQSLVRGYDDWVAAYHEFQP